jgi:hypothetical protein
MRQKLTATCQHCKLYTARGVRFTRLVAKRAKIWSLCHQAGSSDAETFCRREPALRVETSENCLAFAAVIEQ